MATAYITSVSKFTPTQIANCQLWLDASDPATCLRSGSTITNWNDKSGNAKNITIGGSGGLSFGNASGNVGAANSVNTVSGRTSYFTTAVDLRKTTTPNTSVFIVYAWLAAGGGATSQTFWGNDVPNNNNRVQFFDFAVFSSASYGYNLNNGLLTNTTQLNRSTTQLYELVSQTGVTNGTGVYFNGTLGSAGLGSELVNTPSAGNDILYFGGGETSSIYPSYTQFNEILVYNTALTTAQRQQIEGYLSWKWGLVGLLPASHPFKLVPPYPVAYPVPIPMTNQTSFLNAPLQVVGINQCALWLDATDRSTLTLSGSTVTAWRDKSGLNTPTNAYGTPTANATINSVPAINLTNGRFTAAYLSGFNNFRTTTFVVTLLNSYPTAGYACVAYSPTLNTAPSPYKIVRALDYAASTYRTVEFNGTNAYVANVPVTGLSTPFLWSSSFNGTSYALNAYLNGGAATGATTGGAMSQIAYYITIGALDYDNGTNTWPGNVGEIICYAGILSTQERQYVEGYLAWKWGLVGSLPANHPYKNPPYMSFPYGIPRRIQVAQSWLPTAYSGCQLWLDAADTTTLSLSGSSVTQWRDKSGLANNTTVVGGSPTYSSNRILLNGSSTYLVGPYVNTTTTLTAFVIATVDFSSGRYDWYYRLLSVGSTAANDYNNTSYSAVILHQPNTNNIGGYRNGIQNYVAVTTNTSFILGQQYSGSTAQLYLNGTASSPVSSTGTFNTSSYGIGRDVGNTDGGGSYAYWPGSISEVILYNTSLTTAQRQNVEGYLAWKWGLQSSLPSSHPWKLYPPPS